MSGDSLPIARLRARLAGQVGAPLVVSDESRQYFFDEDTAAYAEIDVRRGNAFVLVVVIGSLPSEEFIVKLWHRFVREVWLVEPREEAVYIARPGGQARLLDRSGTLRSIELPDVAIPIDALFALPS